MGKAGSPLSVFSGPWPSSAKLLLAAREGSLPILVVFTALKTAVDLGSHLRERSRSGRAAA